MIRKLKIKFVTLALTALFVLLAVIVAGMNLLNYRAVIDEADATLSVLSQNQGVFPNLEDGRPGGLPPGMSPEIPFQSRFFSVLISPSGEIIHADTSRVYAVDGQVAAQYAKNVFEKKKNCGFLEQYRYISTPERMDIRITFLDCGRELGLYRHFAIFSIAMSLLGYAVTAAAVCFFAGKFIQPVAQSYEKQKRFITDAGHEMRTPLTIISANVDVLKMDMGENECLEDIQRQTKRLTGLTNDLACLARMEEDGGSMQKIVFPASEIVLETAVPFQMLARTQNKTFSCRVQPMLSMYGNEKMIAQLVSILLDNAFKYSPESSRISLRFERQGRRLELAVGNLLSVPLSDENLRHVFDRFYRADPSRNSETAGYGIGLSMAQEIVRVHDGKMSVCSPDGNSFLITADFPAQSI